MWWQLEVETYLRSTQREWVDESSLEWNPLLEQNPLLERQGPFERRPPLDLRPPR